MLVRMLFSIFSKFNIVCLNIFRCIDFFLSIFFLFSYFLSFQNKTDERTIKFFHKFDAPSEEDAVDSIYYFSEKNDKFRVRTPVECAKLEKIFFDTCVNEPKKVTCAGGGRSAHFLGRVTGEEEAKYYIDASNITHTKPMSQTYIDRINALQIAYTENMK